MKLNIRLIRKTVKINLVSEVMTIANSVNVEAEIEKFLAEETNLTEE